MRSILLYHSVLSSADTKSGFCFATFLACHALEDIHIQPFREPQRLASQEVLHPRHFPHYGYGCDICNAHIDLSINAIVLPH